MNSIRFRRPVPANPLTNMIDEFFNKGLNELAKSDLSLTRPSVNIIEKDDAFVIDLAAPGLDKKDFQIKVDKDQLNIKVVQTAEADASTENEPVFRRREFNYSTFNRSFHLPKTVDASSIDATYINGVLSVTLNKKEEAKEKEPITVEIK